MDPFFVAADSVQADAARAPLDNFDWLSNFFFTEQNFSGKKKSARRRETVSCEDSVNHG